MPPRPKSAKRWRADGAAARATRISSRPSARERRRWQPESEASRMNAPLIGARIERKEDYRFLTGAGQYTDDVELPRQTYAAFVRSPHAHAVIKKVKTDKAK